MTDTALEDASWPALQRVERAVAVVDIVESVRLMACDEDSVIERWRRFVREASTELLPRFGGRMVKSLGDGMLLEFGGARSALACARLLLDRMRAVNALRIDGEPIRLRIGIHCAPVVVEDFDVLGSAVNLAARITALAGPDQIVATNEATDQLVNGLDAALEDLGECFLKHFDQPKRVWRLLVPDEVTATTLPAHAPALPQAAELPKPRLAVLSLEVLEAPLTLGALIADELAAQLAAHRSLELISRISTRLLQPVDAESLLQRVGAHYAVSGSCTPAGARIAMTIELSYVAERRVLWSRALSSTLDQIVARPDATLAEVAPAILEAIDAHETGRARSMPLASLASYALLLGGLRLMHRLSRVDFARAHAVFDELIARHPRHPDGYAWLAKWHILEVHQGWSADPRTSAAMARDLARRSLDLDDANSVALVVTGMVRTYNDRRLDDAEALYAKALEQHPNDALAWLLKGTLHAFRGQGQAAVQHTRHAGRLTPLDPMRYYFDSLRASAEASAGHYSEAVRLARRSLRENSMHASTLRILTIAHAMQDEMQQAREAAAKTLALEPEFTVTRFLQRSPSSDYEIGRTFAQALARAGIPP